MTRTLLLAALLAATTATAVWAAPREEMVYYRDGMRIDPAEVSRILAGPSLKRSIRLLPEGAAPAAASTATAIAAAEPETVTAAAAPRVQPESIALPVQFAFDSAEILPRARTQLDAMAEGIKLLPPATRVVIEGHTDAVGTPQYNLQLSRQRAEAVKRYLVTEHGLDEKQLSTVGFGPARPIDGVDASRPDNRRVQFRGA
jgi:outer membrane protein OmpA-like peptidoglycan-associated protein